MLFGPGMRELVSTLVLVLGAAACAARAPQATLPVHYACGDVELVHGTAGLVVHAPRDPDATARRSDWHDGAGDHFVTAPVSPIDRRAVEYIVPTDPRLDATERVYDTSNGSSTADWRVVDSQTCTAHGGYTDALARFMHGESLDEVARELALRDRAAARDLVHHALISLQHRYYADR